MGDMTSDRAFALGCPSSCDACSDADTCTTCKDGYGLTSDDLCEACGDSCEDCLDDVATCVDCADGTTVDDDGACRGELYLFSWCTMLSLCTVSSPQCEIVRKLY